MPRISTIAPCLWFDTEAEGAARFYASIFSDSRIIHVARYPEAGKEQHGMPPGSVMFVDFQLAGQRFGALNGGSRFKFTPAISLQVNCDTQAEIDRYWELLGAEGAPEARQCGWLADKFGLSWQIVPADMGSYLVDAEVTERVMAEVMQMQKLDLATLRRAAAA